MGDTIDLTSFDYRSGKINSQLLRKSSKRAKGQFDFCRGIRNDASLIPPIRQTASIFKQPVTVIKSQPDSKTKHDLKHAGEKVSNKQYSFLFWFKLITENSFALSYAFIFFFIY